MRNKENIRGVVGTGSRMKISKWKNFLIEDNIAGNIDAPCRCVKTFETFVHIAIAKKYTADRSELKFVEIIWT